jgi:hypothetical protein
MSALNVLDHTGENAIETFIARWQSAGGSERANYQLFITELCELLALPKPDPAQADARDNAYVFERRVVFKHGDGSTSNGFIDCYRRAAFILEAKQTKLAETVGKVFDDALMRPWSGRKLRPRFAVQRRPPTFFSHRRCRPRH